MTCTQCNAPLKLIPAGTAKNGKPYPSFWGCNLRCGAKGIPANAPTPSNKPIEALKANDASLILSDEVQAIRLQLEALERYLKSKPG